MMTDEELYRLIDTPLPRPADEADDLLAEDATAEYDRLLRRRTVRLRLRRWAAVGVAACFGLGCWWVLRPAAPAEAPALAEVAVPAAAPVVPQAAQPSAAGEQCDEAPSAVAESPAQPAAASAPVAPAAPRRLRSGKKPRRAAEVPVSAAEAAPLVAAAGSREAAAPPAADTLARPAASTPREYRDRVRRAALAVAAEAGHDLALHDWQ